MRNALHGSYRDRHLIWKFDLLTFNSLYLDHVTEVVSTKSMYRINFSLFRITLYENDRKQLDLFYALRGETSRGLMYSFKACRGNCMHRRTCVVSKCVVVWKTVPFHDDKLMKNTLYIPETIPSRTETRKSDEEFLKKITDLRDYCLFVCLLWL